MSKRKVKAKERLAKRSAAAKKGWRTRKKMATARKKKPVELPAIDVGQDP